MLLLPNWNPVVLVSQENLGHFLELFQRPEYACFTPSGPDSFPE